MSCLYRALAHFVPNDDPNMVRQKICNFLALNRELPLASSEMVVLWESNLDLPSYVSRMRHGSAWGGATEIQAFCELYAFGVSCHNLRRDRVQWIQEFIPKTGVCTKKVNITWNGGHFEPMR